MNQDDVAKALLGMAESLRTQDPPKLKMAIKCARSAVNLDTTEEQKAISNLQLGKLLFFYTENFELAKNHLQYAYEKMRDFGTFYSRDRMHAISMIADLYIHLTDQQWPVAPIKEALKKEIAHTKGFPVLTNKLMFQLIEIQKIDKDADGALEICQSGIQGQVDPKIELYFRITKTLITYQLMHEEPTQEDVLKIGSMIKALEDNPADKPHLDCVKDFFVVTKLAYMFYQGKSRTSRALLRQIQKTSLGQDTKIQGIRWLGDGLMTLWACVMNIVCALLQSNPDRVDKYYNIIVKHTDEYIYKAARTPSEPGVVRCIQMIKMTTLEVMSYVNVMACKPQRTLCNVRDMLEMCHRSSGPLLYRYFAPHVQYILGLQCCYFRQHEYAEKHFKAAIEMLHPNDTSDNTTALLNLNLAMTYLNQLKMADYYEIDEKVSRLTVNRVQGCSQMIKSNVKLLHAYFSYLTNKTNECKQLVHEVLEDSKAEDFFRLHGLALLFMSLIMPVDANGVKPTVEWSKKSNDQVIILWSHNLYERIIRASGAAETSEDVVKAITGQEEARKTLDVDHMIPMVTNMPMVKMLQWFEGDPFKLLPRDDAALL